MTVKDLKAKLSNIPEEASVEIVRWVPSEVTLLKAAWMLLNKQKDSFYVLNLLTETVFYDGADCDGYCLSDDILDYLLDKGINPQAEG